MKQLLEYGFILHCVCRSQNEQDNDDYSADCELFTSLSFLDSCDACHALSWRLALKLSRSNSDKKIKQEAYRPI